MCVKLNCKQHGNDPHFSDKRSGLWFVITVFYPQCICALLPSPAQPSLAQPGLARPCCYGAVWRHPPVTCAHITAFRCSRGLLNQCLNERVFIKHLALFYSQPLLPSIQPQPSHSLTPSRPGLFLDSPDFTAIFISSFILTPKNRWHLTHNGDFTH